MWWCIKKPPDRIKSCVPLYSFNWERMGRTWLSSQSHGRELECGEPVCLPLLSLSESSVCRSPSPSVTPQSAADTQSPLIRLSILALVAHHSLTYSPLQKESMSSSSPETMLKRPGSPCGIPTLPQPIDQLNPPRHFIYLSVFLSQHLAIWLQSLPLVCMLTEDISVIFVCNQYVV